MSTLSTNAIIPVTGSTVTIGESGDTITCGGTASNFGGGKVLQVVSTTKVDTFVTTSNSWTDVTGMSVSITPSSGTKCLVHISMTVCSQATSYAGGRLVRDSTAIAVGTAVGTRPALTWNFYTNQHNGEDHSHSMNILDTHGADGSTAVTYKLQFSSWDSNSTHINKNHQDSDNNSGGRTASTITVMEIGA